MSVDNMDQFDQEEGKAKKGFSFERYVQQLQQMDMDNIGAWPASVKFTMYVFILVLICVLAYFVLIRGVQDRISQAEAQQQNLLNEFRDKDSKLRNLQQYQAQVQLMEVQFNQQLDQLPKETEIPGLVEDINMAGVSSGLEFKNIQLLPEVKQEVFIEQPIDISVTGHYHSMGGFVSAIAALPRIVTLHDFDIKAEEVKGSEVPKLVMNMKAKTYRYMTENDKNKAEESKK
ncbi:MAG: type 4a pilus biogenesis protein PilO [Acinetobacter populi]|jgi:type IV pilus assembly protein PilO|uniref:type 4a pilus biogenesis protein PilO n=1 Tax=Acinetobacter populi TaxID=1582270 RepID=UPI0023578A1E|nr:type 4a pilus biogenesis protein PilO [Acinetobacter populi]MCH4248569.1 type 4a pilus biogenesis protein PilO [Acinetobacter populi]